VREFVINKNARSLYDCMVDNITETGDSVVFNKKLYNTAPMDYVISAKDKNNEEVVYNNFKKKVSKKKYKEFIKKAKTTFESSNKFTTTIKYDSHGDLFSSSYETGSTVISGPIYTSKYSSSKSMISHRTIMTNTSKYACAVVALTEIARQEGILKNSSITDTFNALWTATSTSKTSTETFYGKSVTLGSTKDSKLSSGMTKYCNDMGKKNTTTSTSSNPSFSFFTKAIDSNNSVSLSYRILETSGEKSGHTVNVVGYCTAKKSGITSNYLIVADGWYDDAPKYMNYSSIDFVDTYGVKYIIK